jgi:hypothetical protein
LEPVKVSVLADTAYKFLFAYLLSSDLIGIGRY